MDLPRTADSEADFKTVAAASQSDDRGTRWRAISLLRKSKHPSAAGALGKLINSEDRHMVIDAIASLGAAGEAELLKVIDPNDTADNLRPIMFALIRCGTEKCFPMLDKLQNHSDLSVSGMTDAIRASAQHRARVGR